MPSIFHYTLERLRCAAESNRSEGLRYGNIVVQTHDLRQLLREFDRLDNAARAQHPRQHPE